MMAKKKSLPVASPNAAPVAYKQSKDDRERERRWRAEDGLRTIQQAEEIKRDKQRMADIKALAQTQMDSLKKFAK